jgi:hypothetical protein
VEDDNPQSIVSCLGHSKKKTRPSEFITLSAHVLTNVSLVFFSFRLFLSRNGKEIRYKLRTLRVINPRARLPGRAS